jgi:hypothetical protein
MRDVFHDFVVLDGLKNEEKKVLRCTTERAKIVGDGASTTMVVLDIHLP